jgi:uncharacterized protein (UPF0333 family)
MTTLNEEPVLGEGPLDLVAAVSGLSREVMFLHKYGKRSRALIWGLAVSLSLALLLTISMVFGFFAVKHTSDQANRATSSAAITQNNQYVACISANNTRLANQQLWTYILSLPPTHPQTEVEKQQIASFKVYVDNIFAQQKCSLPIK